VAYQWTAADADAFLAFCAEVGVTDYTIPIKCWAYESNDDPSAYNPAGASGIFQLTPGTAQAIGYPTGSDPNLQAFRRLSVAEQMPWATKFYGPHAGILDSLASFYCVTFLPAQAPKVYDDPGTVVCGRNGPDAYAYNGNTSFDAAGKGYITGNDLAATANKAFGPRAQGIALLVASRAGMFGNVAAMPRWQLALGGAALGVLGYALWRHLGSPALPRVSAFR
jgi:hypothetical protein